MCNCIELVEKELTERNGSKTEFNKLLLLTKGKLSSPLYISSYYHKKKRDGTFEKKETELKVQVSYCPFCGIKNEAS